MKQFDVIIVGAGPAGSFAAERLARAGVAVALFDGRPEGEPKACGGGVTSKALKAWPHLLEAVGRTIDELDMYSPSGKHLHLKLDEPFAVYSRIAFDTFLRERARAAGAHVFAEQVSGRGFKRCVSEPGAVATGSRGDAGSTRDAWTIKTKSGAEFSCKYLVGADGANSAIAKKLAGPLAPTEMEVAFGYRAPLPESGGAATVVAFIPNWDGYAWAFPRLDHVSFGIATAQSTFDFAVLEQYLWDFMIGYVRIYRDKSDVNWTEQRRDDPDYVRVFNEIRETGVRYAARIPKMTAATWETRSFAGANWCLLGDAAGFADPITGEGIFYALRSAEVFSELYVSNQTETYEARCRRDFGRELKRAAVLREKFFGKFLNIRFTEAMIEFGRYHFGIRKTLKELVTGDEGYVRLKSLLLRRAIWPF